ncbi:scavenger receptor cysteine-rich type 1 protein M130-like [Saccostrea echinata]|uniref:scavenger receptor cysteine-rich type 1 protein M130-like n=1 Tax=Saccostrea echinata TaxID=191078 RepID=UPI002A806EF5|nr:scavenger receptor cysteine-rich type 1 protein M130-like [Saccostrea echinata]
MAILQLPEEWKYTLTESGDLSSTKAFYVDSEFYGKSTSITWLTKLQCTSVVYRLWQCSFEISGFFLKSDNFGVVCQDSNSFSIRLVNNQTANSGYVEVFLGGLWGTILHTRPYSSHTWGREAATVACRELGLPHSASLPVRSSMFGSIYSLNWIDRTYCTGKEQSLLDCIEMGGVSYYHSFKAGVICTDTDSVHYRLASNTSAGRVEIKIDGTWGGINKKSWNEKSASLFCKHLQKPSSRALPVVNDVYGFSHWEWLTRVSCYGTENNLIDCPNEVTGQYGTGSAGVVCTDYTDFKVRLNNGSTAGRVEVYMDGEWGGIDSSTWTHSKANIICNQIGLKGKKGLAVNNILYGVTPTLTWIKVKDSCSSDAQILSCSVEVLANRFFPRIEAGVICADVIENVLEIYNGSWYGTLRFFLENEWGTLDADGFGQEEATVACQQLGFYSRKALPVQSEIFGHLDNRVWMKDFKCTGNERNILECPLSIDGFLDNRVKDAGLICQDRASFMVKLAGNSTTQGVVEVFLADRWGTIDPADWDYNAAKSVCRHLQKPSRFGFAVKSGIFYQGSSHQWLSRAICDGNEPTLFDCKLFVSGITYTYQAAAVICSEHASYPRNYGPTN